MAPWPPISRDDLKAAAKDAGFDMVLPVLVRRLIAETGDRITELDMPGGSGVAAGGFDGVAAAAGSTLYVPAGRSAWELSVSSKSGVRALRKADFDYGKRTEGPDGTPTAECTYIELILEPWIRARAWAAQRTRERRWKEVRGYNLDGVYIWLESAPATTVWLADQLGKGIPGVQAAESWWDGTWMPSTSTPLDTDVVLAGRDDAADNFVHRLVTGEEAVILGGDLRPDEAYAFIAAALSGDRLGADAVRARALFVSDTNSLSQLLKQPQPLVLVLTDPAVVTGMPIQHPHQVVLLASPGSGAGVEVPPLNGRRVASILETAGMSTQKAARLGQLARRSLLSLRRSLAVTPALFTPSWSRSPDVVRRRLLLVGAWNGSMESDRGLVAACLGRSYADIQEAALALAGAAEVPFLAHVDESWHLLSPEDTWTLLNGSLTKDDLDAFRLAAEAVLGERDPRLDLPLSERWRAGVMGVQRRYSETLRAAIARGLALLGNDTSSRIVGGETLSQWAEAIVRQVLHVANEDSTYHLWTSLGDLLPVLAEAAPDAFLSAMTVGLEGPQPLHAAMFQDGERGPTGGPAASPHVDFLWALESLAWSPDYFDEAVDALADLAALDPEPEGGWSNRPRQSLVGILNGISPFTAADLDQRIRAVERIHRRRPDVGRRLMLELIPDGRGVMTVHDGPRFRDWGKDRPPATRGDLIAFVSRVVEVLLAALDDDPARFTALLDKVDVISPEHRALFAEHLAALSQRLMDPEARSKVFEAVRTKVASHREYADTEWALAEDQLRLLETAAAGLLPENAVDRHAWLFASDWLTLGDATRRGDLAAYQEAVSGQRAAALAEIAAGGLDQVVALASTARYPGLVGFALAKHSDAYEDDMLAWLESDQAPEREVAFAYLVESMRIKGRTLRDELLSKTDDALTQARVLLASYDPLAAWEKLQELSPEAGTQYWREFRYVGLGTDFAHVVDAARSLAQIGRNAAALDLIAMYVGRGGGVDSVDAAMVAAAALESLIAGGLDDPELPQLARWDYEQLFGLLGRYRAEIGGQRVVHIEWQLFPALGFDADAPTLHAALAEQPTFFAELVSYIFRRDTRDEEPSADEGDQERRPALARRAFEVLHTWRRCPGVRPDGSLDRDGLTAWVHAARDQLSADDRLGAGDEQIGRVMAFAPTADDGIQPPQAVRDLLEEVHSQRLEAGLRIGILNRRGMTTRDPEEGGDQEWRLARTYREQAESAATWPRTRRVLNQIAESYEAQARRQDAEAEHLRRGL
jgi:hypothetical protein